MTATMASLRVNCAWHISWPSTAGGEPWWIREEWLTSSTWTCIKHLTTTHRTSLSRLQSHGFDRSATQSELGFGWMVALKDLSLFSVQLKSSHGWHSSGVSTGTTTVWLKEHFTWEYWHVVSQKTPQSVAYPCGEGYCAEFVLVTLLSRTVPVSWRLPGSLGAWGWAASFISLSTPTWPTHPFRAIYQSSISGSCWKQGAAWFRSVFRTYTWGRLLMYGLTSAFLSKSCDKGQPVDSGAPMYLLTWLYYLLLYFSFSYDDRAFALGLKPKDLEVFLLALFCSGNTYRPNTSILSANSLGELV